jgi:NAD(P)-dependent dehydrogenase (short-subunit alcohol dehydrogenase family)
MNKIRSVVITGASSGIGRASVLRMSSAGWHVFATVRRPQDAERLQARTNPNVFPLILDVEDQRDLQKIFDVNLFGQIAVTQAFLPLLHRQRGRIVNITSVGAHIAIPFGGLLNASKSAFGILSDALRLELHPFGIRVSTIEPGAIATPAVEKTLGDVNSVVAGLPAQGQAQYGKMLRSLTQRGYKREMNGSPPEVVARAIHHALTARRPHIRYRVGKDASFLSALSRILPDWLLDALRFRALGLPTRFGVLRYPEVQNFEDRAA